MNIQKLNAPKTRLLTIAILLQSAFVPAARAQEQKNPVVRQEPLQTVSIRQAQQPRLLAAARKPRGFAAQTAATTLVGASSTLLPDGRWLTLGGADVSGPLSKAFLKISKNASSSSPISGLLHPRAWHTATVLPDGSVFIFGGLGTRTLVSEAELFDPSTQSFREIAANLEARAYHTATLLTDGRVLIAGGIGADGKPLSRLDLWDPRSKQTQTLASTMLFPRRDHTATLQSDGTVLIQGGVLADGSSAVQAEMFQPDTQTVSVAGPLDQATSSVPTVVASIPSDGATNVPINAIPSFRFSKFLSVATVNTSTVTLTGPNGAVSAKVVGAEGGRLAFLTPDALLQPWTTYTISITGAIDLENLTLQQAQLQFTTNAATDLTNSSGAAKPDAEDPPVPPLQAGPGVTALSGQVRTVDGKYLTQVTLELNCGEEKGKRNRTVSDGTGRFLLANVPQGHCKLEIDGTTVHRGSDVYGIFTPGVDITNGITNILPYTIWMTSLDMAHAVTIPSPTPGTFVVTNPAIPGLELHLPPNAVVKDYDGNPVTQLTITRISVARPPFPLPGGVQVPFYFTIQPGGAYIEVNGAPGGASLYYPNMVRAPAGFRFSFWNYDPTGKGWFVYGKGTVDANRRYIVPDPGVAIYQFTGAMIANPDCNTCGPTPPAPPLCPPDCGGPPTGDPIDPSSGLFLYNATDLSIADVIPIALTRTYRQSDPMTRPFGVGISHNYEMYLMGDRNPYTYVDLVLPDSSRVHYVQIGNGSGFGSSKFQTTQPTAFYMSTITYGGGTRAPAGC
jgi:hypothetical protein